MMHFKFVTRVLLLAWMLTVGAAESFGAFPSVSSFTPTKGGPGTQVTITGQNFTGATQVQFGGALANYTVNSATQITAFVPTNGVSGVISVTASGTTASSGTQFTVAPRIDAFSPTFGGIGASIRVDGANFIVGGTTVKFGTVSAATPNITATGQSSQMFVTVPSGAVTAPILVTTTAGTGSSVSNFIVSGTAPVITDFDPPLATTGTIITINGGDFTSVTNVSFNNVVASFNVTAPTQIRATVPAAATTGPIRVIRNGSTGISASNFVVAGKAPLITGFSPVAGKPGDPVVITGLNFTTVTNSNAVRFGSLFASYGVSSDTQISAIVPVGATTGLITITNSGGSGNSSSNFIIGPLVDGFTPSSGPWGTNVVITGANFIGVNKVLFGTNNAASFTVGAANQITAKVPAGAVTAPITVGSADGTNTTSSNFVVTASAPSISSVDPGNGQPGTVVTLTGANFTGTTNVSFNGTNASFSVTADSQISTTVPAGATTGFIRVANLGGSALTATPFYIQPVITGYSPPGGVVSSNVAILGTNLTGASLVEFSTTNLNIREAAVFTVNSDNQITATIPTNAVTGSIRITTPGGVVISTTNVAVHPRILFFSPDIGPVGTVITITGNSFYDVTSVSVNGRGGPFTKISATQVSIPVPSLATTGFIIVNVNEAPGVGGSATSSLPFTVTTPVDLAVTQTNTPTVALMPGTVTFSMTVTNKSASPATQVKLLDVLPQGLTFVSATISQGSYTYYYPATNSVVFEFSVLQAHASATATLTASAAAPGLYEHSVTVSSQEGDLQGADNFNRLAFNFINDAQRTLSIRLVDPPTSVEVSWPNSQAPLILQTSTALKTNLWIDAPDIVVLATNQVGDTVKVITNSAPFGNKFYRLRLP